MYEGEEQQVINMMDFIEKIGYLLGLAMFIGSIAHLLVG